MTIVHDIGNAFSFSFQMFWQVFWPLALGFLLSAVIETVVSKKAIANALGDDTIGSAARATAFGAASSSCSYAAISVARTLFRKGATLRNAIIFEFASTNLVVELGLILLVLLGWQFLTAELAGGIVMVILLALLFRVTLRPRRVEQARATADRGRLGKMEGHGAMDMSITDGPFLRRLFSPRAVTAISHYFYMSVASLWSDVLIGFLIAGAIGAWVPTSFWNSLFLNGNGTVALLIAAFVGPLIAMLSFVCSVGNVPLAAVLWRGGMSFGGAIAFIFGDLIIIPILNIYRKYYGARVSVYLFAVSYITMVAAGILVGLAFSALHATPSNHTVHALQTSVSWDATTILNIVFLALAALLGVRFLRTGGMAMLKEMEHPPSETATRDPVCGMTVDPARALSTTTAGVTNYFCSAGCRDAFVASSEGVAP